jgi:hypothetical protein
VKQGVGPDGDRITKILPGTNVTVRTDESIDVEKKDKAKPLELQEPQPEILRALSDEQN